MVAHRDRQHPHVHIVVNRVHPERRTAWSNSWDYRRIEGSLRAQEAELGLRVVPGKHAPVHEHARERIRHAPERVRGDDSFLARARAEAGPVLTRARSWAELERGLAERGLSLRMKGRGMVLTDGRQEVKASEIDREALRFRLERRLGLYSDYRARQAVAARTMDERVRLPELEERVRRLRERVRDGAERAVISPEIKPARERVQIPPAKAEHRRVAESYRAALDQLYHRPRGSHARFRDAVLRDGREAAVRTLAERPERFGVVRRAGTPVEERARDAAQEAYRWAGRVEQRGRPELRRLAAELREHHAAERYDEASRALEQARSAADSMGRQRGHIRANARDAALHARGVYVSPREALGKIGRSVRRVGSERTAKLLHEAPERFGALRTVTRSRYWGLAKEYDTGPAREKARIIASHVNGLDFNRQRAASLGDVVRAREASHLLLSFFFCSPRPPCLRVSQSVAVAVLCVSPSFSAPLRDSCSSPARPRTCTPPPLRNEP